MNGRMSMMEKNKSLKVIDKRNLSEHVGNEIFITHVNILDIPAFVYTLTFIKKVVY